MDELLFFAPYRQALAVGNARRPVGGAYDLLQPPLPGMPQRAALVYTAYRHARQEFLSLLHRAGS